MISNIQTSFTMKLSYLKVIQTNGVRKLGTVLNKAISFPIAAASCLDSTFGFSFLDTTAAELFSRLDSVHINFKQRYVPFLDAFPISYEARKGCPGRTCDDTKSDTRTMTSPTCLSDSNLRRLYT
ncbi:hypothetical protein RND81_02G040300 [Saponaria officinalis]|uniref:Uncharacterized protein n=1 Tax=Saponaria officinalis TaxID=3572 RepID=A0AAW1MRK5_SAPOF